MASQRGLAEKILLVEKSLLKFLIEIPL